MLQVLSSTHAGLHLNVFGKVSVNELGFEKELFMGCI
jgi:hypothetical protein